MLDLISKIRLLLSNSINSYYQVRDQKDLEIVKAWRLIPERSLNPITNNPKRYFSQSDEDGILEKILIRIGKYDHGSVIEFGVGDGKENNSLALISRGWKSYWIGGENLCFQFPTSNKHYFIKAWVTLDNLNKIICEAVLKLKSDTINVASMDLDGNDYHFVKYLLENHFLPDVWILEYNAKFPPGAQWIMPYNEGHVWNNDDYFGASYSSYLKLLHRYNYFPVACSVQGANIFFVKDIFRSNFEDVPTDPNDLYQPPFYYLPQNWGHEISPLTLERVFIMNRN